MHTGQPNPQSTINEYIVGKIVLDNSNNKFVFPALNVSNNVATIDYDAHINTNNVCPKHSTCWIPFNRNPQYFLYVGGSTAWLYDCPHFLSPLYITDRCFDRIPIHFKDTLMYVDPITRQFYDYAIPITCYNHPENIKIFTFLDLNLLNATSINVHTSN